MCCKKLGKCEKAQIVYHSKTPTKLLQHASAQKREVLS